MTYKTNSVEITDFDHTTSSFIENCEEKAKRLKEKAEKLAKTSKFFDKVVDKSLTFQDVKELLEEMNKEHITDRDYYGKIRHGWRNLNFDIIMKILDPDKEMVYNNCSPYDHCRTVYFDKKYKEYFFVESRRYRRVSF
jgi:hypothetical protein